MWQDMHLCKLIGKFGNEQLRQRDSGTPFCGIVVFVFSLLVCMQKDKQKVVWPSPAHGLITRGIVFLMLDMSDLF